jgi:DNA-binding LytR/AlgR family response regulator
MHMLAQLQAACSPANSVAFASAHSFTPTDGASDRVLRALVASPNSAVRSRLCRLLAENELACFEVRSTSSLLQMEDVAVHGRFDLLISDVDVHELSNSGFQPELDDCRVVILLGDDAAMAQAAFDLGVADYLSTTSPPERLNRALVRAFALHDAQLSSLNGPRTASRARDGGPEKRWIRAMRNGELVAAPLDDILFFQAERKLTRVVLPHADAYLRLGINAVADNLGGLAFWRIHRGTIINAKYLSAMSRDELGRVEVRLRDRPERLRLSKAYERSLFSDGFF